MYARSRIFGVKFSAARDAHARTWIAEGTLDGAGLTVRRCEPAGVRFERRARLADCIKSVRALIAETRDGVFGLDFPFGLPVNVSNGQPWPAFVDGFGRTFAGAKSFRRACRRAAGRKGARRRTDDDAKTPFSPFDARVFQQTYHGIRFLLAPLFVGGDASILPMTAPPQADRAWVVEVNAASTIRTCGLPASYKGGGRMGSAVRQIILNSVRTGFELEAHVTPEVEPIVLKNARGDALDAVLCAFAAARAICEPTFGAIPQPPYSTEGVVYV